MSGILGGIVNALGAANQGNVIADQEKVKSALQQAQIARQGQQDQIAAAIRARQEQSSLLQDRLTQAQIGDTTAQTQQRLLPPKPTPKKYQYITGPDGSVSAVNEADPTDITAHLPGVQGKVEHNPVGPVAHFTIQNVTGADGKVHLARVNSLTGEVEELPNLGKQPSSASGGGAAGAQVPVADMQQRYGEIADAAGALGRGEWKMTPSMQTREGLNYANTLDNASGHPSITHQFLNGAVNTLGAGGDDYPKYQALMNSTRALGDDVAKVFKGRQNEQSVIREIGLSQLTPDDYGNPQVVEQKLSRLRHIIHLAELNNPDQNIGQGGNVPSPTAPTGHSIKSKYGLE